MAARFPNNRAEGDSAALPEDRVHPRPAEESRLYVLPEVAPTHADPNPAPAQECGGPGAQLNGNTSTIIMRSLYRSEYV